MHAYSTTLKHPFSGHLLHLKAPIPEDMKTVLSKLNPISSATGFPDKSELFDQETGYLTCSLEVKEIYGSGGGRGSDHMEVAAKGFVPYDRLTYEDEHFTSFDLPETMDNL